MNLSLDIVLKVGEILALIGFYYGVIKTRIDNQGATLNRIDAKISRIMTDQIDSKIKEGQQPILLAAINEKIEQHCDRLDVHDEAIKNIEISLASRPTRTRN
jgi:hypothetical protein